MLIRAFFLLLLMGCNVSYAGLFGDDKAREQISVLRSQVEALEARVAKMEEALGSQALLGLYSQVETMGIELGRMRGQLEMLSNDSTILQKRQKDFYIDLDSRLRQIEQPGVAVLPALPVDEPVDLSKQIVSPPESIATPLPELNPESSYAPDSISQPVESSSASLPITELVPADSVQSGAYDAAYSLFINGDYAGAITQFDGFLQNYPKSSLAPGAAYWIGNAHYASRDFQEAINAQERLLSMYPDSSKAPDALLNIASSQQEMADSKAAKQTLEDLVARYPFSDAAERAKQRLANL
jgi:tol-pal system protein YbgF